MKIEANTMVALDERLVRFDALKIDDHTIDVVLTVNDGALRIEVIDDGQPFNPLEVPEPDTSLAMADRPIGGLGIHLLRELADEATYERRDRTNRLVLLKRMS